MSKAKVSENKISKGKVSKGQSVGQTMFRKDRKLKKEREKSHV